MFLMHYPFSLRPFFLKEYYKNINKEMKDQKSFRDTQYQSRTLITFLNNFLFIEQKAE